MTPFHRRGWSTKPFELALALFGFGWGLWILDPRFDSMTTPTYANLRDTAANFTAQFGLKGPAESVWGGAFVLVSGFGIAVLLWDYFAEAERWHPRAFLGLRALSCLCGFLNFSSLAHLIWESNAGHPGVVCYSLPALAYLALVGWLVIPELHRHTSSTDASRLYDRENPPTSSRSTP